uniref:Uncharacterized protein n=1 Tax=Pseudictyota dubia TaxID=2749911 RepID=A0A7R9VPR5_9STRA|mmetsp:Transcript_20262/g.38100  ORF Transcript_20262/g.38100 Transcript_20262/m.38100 type:complete len:289 (+) Transcript_20262:227-1093(+)
MRPALSGKKQASHACAMQAREERDLHGGIPATLRGGGGLTVPSAIPASGTSGSGLGEASGNITTESRGSDGHAEASVGNVGDRGGALLPSGGRVPASGGGGLSLLGLLLSLDLLGVTVEEQIDGDIPVLSAGDGATKAEHLTGKEPEHEADGVLVLVVARDGDVNVTERGVRVAESDDGDVDVGSLLHRLVVLAGVADDEDTGLTELLGDLVSERARGVAARDSLGTSVVAVLEDGAGGVGARADGDDISGVLDGNKNAGSKLDLLAISIPQPSCRPSCLPPARRTSR